MPAGIPTPEGHYVKLVTLPSGKTIEVVYFESARVSLPARELHVCAECDSGLVYPAAWEEAGPESWRVELRCPNCEWSAVGVFSQDRVDAFDERLDEGTEQLVSDLKQLMHANMSEEIDRFVTALDAEAVLPEDF